VTNSARARGHGRAADALGHHATQLLIGSIVAVVLLPWLPLPGVFTFTLPIALFGFVILCYVLMRQHDRRLCEACMLSMPLNAAERASRYQKRFWMAHNMSDVKFMAPYMVVLISSNFATGTTIGLWAWAVIQLSMIYLIQSYTTHRMLQPWCPWCSDGGGGSHVDELPPVLPHDDRQLV
jgi:hypothetical protein